MSPIRKYYSARNDVWSVFFFRLTIEPRGYGSYRWRLWLARQAGKLVWRASLEHTMTGERRAFANLERLCAFLNALREAHSHVFALDSAQPMGVKSSHHWRSGSRSDLPTPLRLGANMRCWIGGEEAEGVCHFCGRALCKKHAKTRAFLFETWEDSSTLRGLAVEDALWCGICKVRSDPIDVDFLKKQVR